MCQQKYLQTMWRDHLPHPLVPPSTHMQLLNSDCLHPSSLFMPSHMSLAPFLFLRSIFSETGTKSSRDFSC